MESHDLPEHQGPFQQRPIISWTTSSEGEFTIDSSGKVTPKFVSVSLSPDARDALKAYALAERLSMSDAVLKLAGGKDHGDDDHHGLKMAMRQLEARISELEDRLDTP